MLSKLMDLRFAIEGKGVLFIKMGMVFFDTFSVRGEKYYRAFGDG